MAWYALYTKSRVEKKVALRLEEQGITCYCPLTKKRKQWSDRKKWVEEPLFKSYVFVNIDLAQQSSQVRQVNGVVNFVYWLHKPAVIQDAEIKSIQHFLSEHAEVEAFGNVVNIGDFVTLDSGALAGQKAEVLGFKNKHEVRLKIESLGFELVAYINQSQ
ncbi:UpxY family transcription antiterminator [Aquirufa aurantiipilula]|uniref:UpxY family transcription antiterminator n=1 Tax=Aquirufa aurantiipilula TaxID=2696561 RepID=A0ABT6BIW6_9BACT|nr:UpxY family transcription antiterminator [Aquirufa aurantiipilula]MDF5690274.1 UpxY family transcription antiterminator [Aquirufa aurantiipilula]